MDSNLHPLFCVFSLLFLNMNAAKWMGCAEGNYEPGNHTVEGIVIHLMDGTLVGTDAWFSDPRAKVSAHYGIGRNGEIHQYVLEQNRAYHAGRVNPEPPVLPILAAHPGRNPNGYLLGIEHEGTVDDDWPEAQVQASAELVADICTRYGLAIDRDHIVKHHEIYALKPCPGPKCPMDEIIARALAIASPPEASS
jgi:N-acetylmuramoyl-L-alanine amidase